MATCAAAVLAWAAGHDDHAARDCDALAARGISPLLALEITEPGRSAEDRRKFTGIDPADEH
jgi:hypothetical protein